MDELQILSLKHGDELYQDKIPRHAFVFISMDFTNSDEKLREISDYTSVSGTAIDAYILLELSSKISQKKLSISEIYSDFTTNKLFVCP